MIGAAGLILLATATSSRDSLLAQTQGNVEVWMHAFETMQGEELLCAEYLFENIPRLDRLEMTAEALEDHILGAIRARSACYGGHPLPDSLFLPFVLDYRIGQEPVTPYRKALGEFWGALLPGGADPLSAAVLLTSEIGSRTAVTEPGYLGGVEPPLAVLESASGTPGECTVLLCASLRSLGFACRQVDGWFAGPDGGARRWVEVWTVEGEWLPVLPPWEDVPEGFQGLALAVCEATGEAVTEGRAPVGRLVVEPSGAPSGEEWMGSVNVPVGSGYIPLDWTGFDPAAGDTLVLGAGEYLLCVSRREPDGGVHMRAMTVVVEPGSDLVFRPFR
jgi:hypothetical protein